MRAMLARGLYAVGAIHAWGAMRGLLGLGGPMFLTGHRVVPDAAGDDVDRMALLSGHAITPEELERRLRFLKTWVMSPGSPQDLRSGLPTRRRFYLTFDDGYVDNVVHAAPVLARLDMAALMFVVDDLVANPFAQPWWDRWGAEAIERHGAGPAAVGEYNLRCAAAKREFRGLETQDLQAGGVRRYVDAEGLARLPAVFFVANHTKSHANLTCLDTEGIEQQIELGARRVESHPHYLPVLAYPFGSLNDLVLGAVHGCGKIAVAFATGAGKDSDKYQARRMNINVIGFPLFAAQAVGLLR